MSKRKSKQVSASARLPAWPATHFENTVNGMDTLRQLVHLSEKGISVLCGMPAVIEALADLKNESGDKQSINRVAIARKEAKFAQVEVDRGFPVLHSLAAVALWSELEHYAKGFVALWLTHRKDALAVPAVQKLKVRLGDYIGLTRAAQAWHIVELLEQELAAPMKLGVSRFESLLEPFSLGGSLPGDCGKTLFELQQVRNVIVHRNGNADRMLRIRCPWLEVKLNTPLVVTQPMLVRYFDATAAYSLEIFYRVGSAYGRDIRPKVQVPG